MFDWLRFFRLKTDLLDGVEMESQSAQGTLDMILIIANNYLIAYGHDKYMNPFHQNQALAIELASYTQQLEMVNLVDVAKYLISVIDKLGFTSSLGQAILSVVRYIANVKLNLNVDENPSERPAYKAKLAPVTPIARREMCWRITTENYENALSRTAYWRTDLAVPVTAILNYLPNTVFEMLYVDENTGEDFLNESVPDCEVPFIDHSMQP